MLLRIGVYGLVLCLTVINEGAAGTPDYNAAFNLCAAQPMLQYDEIQSRSLTAVDPHFGQRTSLYPLNAGDRSHCIWEPAIAPA
jgi:hypothetical protein